jgi:nucleoside 2-deoxyribosyltransferase
VCHTGYKGNPSAENTKLPFARATIEGIAEVLPPEQLNERVLTVLTSTRSSIRERAFRIGATLELGIHKEIDPLPVISMSQVVCLGGGAEGVQDIFQKALALRIPALPLPFFGRMCRNLFFAFAEPIKRNFALTEEVFRAWAHVKVEHLSAERASKLAVAVTQSLVGAIRRKCLVFMPFSPSYSWVFDRVIRPAADRGGYDAIRLDLQAFAGDIGNQFRQELAACDCVVAVITSENANVLYEVGFAHAIGKDVIFLAGAARGRVESELPFYIRNHRTLFYPRAADDAAIEDSMNVLATELKCTGFIGERLV